jgi:eukaryotic-like serine/threonine-protein kinase
VRLQDTDTGETIAEEAFTGNEGNLFELASQAGVRLRENLGLSLSLATATGATRVTLPANETAIRLFTEGRDRLWSFDLLAARDLLQKAVAADPKYPLAHLDLSRAWALLGYDANSRKEAKRALDLSQQLPQEDALIIQGQYYQSINENSKAAETYHMLFSMFPDSLDYGLRLASVQLGIKATEALSTLATLKNLPSPLGDDPRIDLLEASAWVDQDLQKARAAAERAITKANAQGSASIMARGYGFLCQQGATYGASFDRAILECQKAQNTYIAVGDKNNAARTLNDFAVLYYQQGDLTKAKSMWSEAIAAFREVGDPEGLAASANNLGDTLILQGNLDEGRRLLLQAISGYKAIDDKDGQARALVDQAEISREKGDLAEATNKYKKAVAIASEFDDKSASAYALAGLGDVLTDQGDLTAARKFYNEALELRKQVGENQTIAETKLSLAKLSIEEGHSADVENEIRQCKDNFHQQKQPDDELAASILLSEALRAQSKHPASQAELAASQPWAEKTQNRLLEIRYRLELARALLSSNQPESASASLEQISKESKRFGFAEVRFETMLTQAEFEKRSGLADAARTQLAALRVSASGKGFMRIAKKASDETATNSRP